ncbi:MAG: helical backbone metal receptor, partial [Bacteroidota bacterium]
MMRRVTDQLGRTVEIPINPQRVISLVPSQTELLFALGLDEEVIGITKFCVHPKEQFQKKERIGGTKRLKIERIRELNPDFILANKEENDAEQILALAEEFPTWVSDISTLDDATEMIRQVSK